jgi:hypothetical protein
LLLLLLLLLWFLCLTLLLLVIAKVKKLVDPEQFPVESINLVAIAQEFIEMPLDQQILGDKNVYSGSRTRPGNKLAARLTALSCKDYSCALRTIQFPYRHLVGHKAFLLFCLLGGINTLALHAPLCSKSTTTTSTTTR